jgi:hypothetical protein
VWRLQLGWFCRFHQFRTFSRFPHSILKKCGSSRQRSNVVSLAVKKRTKLLLDPC